MENTEEVKTEVYNQLIEFIEKNNSIELLKNMLIETIDNNATVNIEELFSNYVKKVNSTVIDFLIKNKPEKGNTRKAVICKDGFKVSIQASEHHYCIPRMNNLENYSCVELGYPSKKEDSILEYAEIPESPTSTVYGYVPIEIVEHIIKKHGGIIN